MTGWTTSRLAPALGCLAVALAVNVPARAQERPIVVGAVVSQTGPHADLAVDYKRGLELWAEEVNAAGGLLGRKVELRLLDDASEAVKAGELHVRLIRQDKADLLIGPYGTAATLMGAAEAESARRVMVTGAAPSRAVHKRSPRYVFQAGIPYGAYGAGPLELAQGRGYKNLFIIARDDPASREMAEATREKALKAGFNAPDIELYQGGASDFLPQVLKARAVRADAWIAFGEVRDAGEMLKTLKKQDYAPGLFFVRGASDPALMKRVGQDAEFVLGARAYEPGFATPGNARFAQAFAAKFSKPPELPAAEGYSAACVLAEGVRKAATLDQEKLRAALASLSVQTVLGEYKVDPLTGEQVAARPALTQVQAGKERLVWPEALAAAKPVLPFPGWRERKILK